MRYKPLGTWIFSALAVCMGTIVAGEARAAEIGVIMKTPEGRDILQHCQAAVDAEVRDRIANGATYDITKNHAQNFLSIVFARWETATIQNLPETIRYFENEAGPNNGPNMHKGKVCGFRRRLWQLQHPGSRPSASLPRPNVAAKRATDSYARGSSAKSVPAEATAVPLPPHIAFVKPDDLPEEVLEAGEQALNLALKARAKNKPRCPAANMMCPPAKGTEVRHILKLGSQCIDAKLLQTENYNNSVDIELANNCTTAQVIATHVETADFPHARLNYVLGPPYFDWFGKTFPVFNFRPIEPFPITMYPGQKLSISAQGGKVTTVKTAACDYTGPNKVFNRLYTDLTLHGFDQFVCVPNPEPPPKPFSLTR